LDISVDVGPFRRDPLGSRDPRGLLASIFSSAAGRYISSRSRPSDTNSDGNCA
jgi:hypothetical protein